jgi:gliding motility-associated-like protein
MKRVTAILIFLAFYLPLSAQYTLNGYATQDACNAYTLTQAAGNQNGSVWNNNKINLTQSFDYKFDVNLGSSDAGADGIVFVLQPISTSVGSSGGGLGYLGVSPAVGVTIDTYQNAGNNDPTYDHIAIQLNGDIGHTSTNNIAGPVTAINGNNDIEDGLWHSLRIVWDATTKTFSAYIDGSLRVTVVKDFVTDVFSGDPLVYWGFTGSTGGANNHQRFRTALNPSFHFSATQKRCVNEPIQFFDSTVSFTAIAKFYWDFGDGSPIDSVNLNPVHVYPVANDYTVKQRVIGADGCETTNTQVVRIGSKPVAGFINMDSCVNLSLHFQNTSQTAVGTINDFYWDFDNGGITSTLQFPTTVYTTGGIKNIKLAVKSLEGCVSDTLYKPVHIYGRPAAVLSYTDSLCLGSTFTFTDHSIPLDAPINGWTWIVDGVDQNQNTPTFSYTFLTAGSHTVQHQVSATGIAGCFGYPAIPHPFVVNKPTAYFKNSTICQSVLTTLTDSSYTTDGIPITGWWWDLGNGQFSTQQNPSITYNTTGPKIIRHVTTNARGCISDTLTQTINVSAKPVANFGFSNPLCTGLPVQFSDSTAGNITKWSWIYNSAVVSTQQTHSIAFTVTNPTIALVVTNAMGCISDTSYKTLFVNPVPDVTMNFKDACKNAVVDFTASDNSGTVTSWQWLFGDGASVNNQNAQHVYTANGTYNVKLIASAATGCYSGSLQKDIIIYSTNVNAGNDTIAASGQPVQLNATGGLSYSWTPALPLSNPNIGNPLATVTATQKFTVRAFTPEGCESFDTITVKIYKGPDIYLPNAFTPNGDGLNDVFRGTMVGIKQFNYLKIFSRWGELVFSTTDYRKGWDGLWKGKIQNNGVYIVIASGIDFLGNAIEKKQTVMLIH